METAVNAFCYKIRTLPMLLYKTQTRFVFEHLYNCFTLYSYPFLKKVYHAILN
jgi:hypothetical protein